MDNAPQDARINLVAEQEKFETGSKRGSRKGKGRYDLLPPQALREVCLIFEGGAIGYGDRNWERGQPLCRYLDSALRHIFQLLEGRTDENHAAQGAWNLLAFIETRHRIRLGILPAELDDMPRYLADAPLAECDRYTSHSASAVVAVPPPETHADEGLPPWPEERIYYLPQKVTCPNCGASYTTISHAKCPVCREPNIYLEWAKLWAVDTKGE